MRGIAIALLGALLLTAPLVSALPTPGFFGTEARDLTGRLFPEAMDTNDYVGFYEGLEYLQMIEEENPGFVTFHQITESVGWDMASGGHESLPVFAVTLTNPESTIPLDKRINLLFMLSIHGNEKGGREGGFRVIEDFVLAHQGGGDVGVASSDRLAMLDYMRLIFLFPNPDGWAHEELEFRPDNPEYISVGPVETQNFVRVNGNGVDLNRQAPTQGWSRAQGSHEALSQPESQGYFNWLKTNFTKIHFASDIHGMLYPANALVNSSRPIVCTPVEGAPVTGALIGEETVCLREGNFVLTMLPATQMTPREEVVITGLAELLRERMNADPYFAEWNALPGAGVWGGDYNDWGTVWDTIGYVDSGFSSDFFAQDTGLDAPGVDFELSYNHITFDNYYPGLGQRMNAYHVETVRIIVGTFMDIAALNTQVTIETDGQRTAYVPSRVVATSEDDTDPLTGWAKQNPADDLFDYEHVPFTATINDYFRDLQPALADGDLPAVLDEVQPEEVANSLSGYDNLVIAGSAARPLLDRPAAVQAVRTFVEGGGTLLLTDEALELLAPLGIVGDGDVDQALVYAGFTAWVDREHSFTAGVRGLARQLYEPMPLGFQEGDNSPSWSIDREAWESAGGATVGVLSDQRTNVGELSLGDGRIVVIGALLPDPTEEYYHPYGLASYATTYTGNQLVRNAMGWTMTFEQPPRVTEAGVLLPSDEPEPNRVSDPAGSEEDESSIPMGWMVPFLGLLGALAVARARRDE